MQPVGGVAPTRRVGTGWGGGCDPRHASPGYGERRTAVCPLGKYPENRGSRPDGAGEGCSGSAFAATVQRARSARADTPFFARCDARHPLLHPSFAALPGRLQHRWRDDTPWQGLSDGGRQSDFTARHRPAERGFDRLRTQVKRPAGLPDPDECHEDDDVAPQPSDVQHVGDAEISGFRPSGLPCLRLVCDGQFVRYGHEQLRCHHGD